MYLLLKCIHLAGVIVFLGNIALGFFWHRHAWATRDPKLLAHTIGGIIRADRLFTVPSVLVLFAAGIATAMIGRVPILSTGWIVWTIVLFAIAGFVSSTRIAPLQRQMLAIAHAANHGGAFDEPRYEDLLRRWQRWGALALLTLSIGVALMVLKPAF